MSLTPWGHRRDFRSDARLHRFHFSLKAWSCDLIKGYWKSVWWIFRYSFHTRIAGMSRLNCISVWRQTVHYFQSNRSEPLLTERFSFSKFWNSLFRLFTKYLVDVCEVGEASQHSEKLKGGCKILTGVSENERTREGSRYKIKLSIIISKYCVQVWICFVWLKIDYRTKHL